MASSGREPFAPHASGRGPLSWFVLASNTCSACMFAQAGGSVLQTKRKLKVFRQVYAAWTADY